MKAVLIVMTSYITFLFWFKTLSWVAVPSQKPSKKQNVNTLTMHIITKPSMTTILQKRNTKTNLENPLASDRLRAEGVRPANLPAKPKKPLKALLAVEQAEDDRDSESESDSEGDDDG